MRKPEFIILVGTNGTGKTTFIINNLLPISKLNIIVPANIMDATTWREKAGCQWITKKTEVKEGNFLALPEDESVNNMLKNSKLLKNASLIIDDFKNYLPSSGPLPPHWRQFLSNRRHAMLDVILAAHDPAAINPGLFAFAPKIILFRTTRPFAPAIKDKVLDYKALRAMQNRVNNISKRNPYYCELFSE